MLPAAFTALVLVMMLLIILSFLFGAWREYRRYKRMLATRTRLAVQTLDAPSTLLVSTQNAGVAQVQEQAPLPPFSLPPSWYNRRRTLVSLGFLVMVVLTLAMQSGLAGGTLERITKKLETTILSYSHPTYVQTLPRPLPQTASARLVRIDSGDRRQYYTDYQWRVWAYSSCSGIALQMVMNAYGRNLIAADVLQKELDLGVWNVQLGLLREEGVAMTAAYYGFETSWGRSRTLPEVINIANKGAPVIVSVRDSYYFPGGHIFVVRGGDSQNVFIADSSPANFQRMTHAQFMNMWQRFSAVVTPKK
jgi:hypothetical protein